MSEELISRPEHEQFKEHLDSRLHRLEKRVEQTEQDLKTLTELTIAVKEMAIHLEGVREELQKQGERLEQIEQEPADTWRAVKRTILTVIITAVVTGVITYFVK